MLLALVQPSQWGFFAFLTLFYAYPLTLFVGVPFYLYFRRRGWLRLWQVVGASAVVGVAIPTLIIFPLGLAIPSGQLQGGSTVPLVVGLALPVLGGAVGALIAAAFWLIAVRPRFGVSDAA
jgi:hypothetical protein